jgi:hypothetical protein
LFPFILLARAMSARVTLAGPRGIELSWRIASEAGQEAPSLAKLIMGW